jgi:hypothetical protein
MRKPVLIFSSGYPSWIQSLDMPTLSTNKGDENDLEEAFRLIKEGNQQTEEKSYWKASESYAQAQTILFRLADSRRPSSVSSSEQAKINALYRQQAAEYLHRARGSLVSSLQVEAENDRIAITNNTPSNSDEANVACSTLLSSLSEEECFNRMNLFGRLFAKELEDAKTIDEKEAALAARLQQLSDSLPSSFKTEAERVRDLNRGLARLGLSRITDPSDSRTLLHHMDDGVPKTETEQVELILAQARDEVAVHAGTGGLKGMTDTALAEAAAAGTLVINSDEPTEVIENDDDDDSVPLSATDDDADLTPEVCKDFHGKLIAAQLAIAELVALFDVDQDSDAAIEFEQPRGRALLKQARLKLRQVAEKWDAC